LPFKNIVRNKKNIQHDRKQKSINLWFLNGQLGHVSQIKPYLIGFGNENIKNEEIQNRQKIRSTNIKQAR